MHRLLTIAAILAAALLLASCGNDSGGGLVEVDLTAEVVDWTVVDGEIVEVWGYNGEYPGPTINAEVGDTIRVNLTNNLPEGTTIHWHGIEVPNDQDGVPGITQPIVEPGQSWTYEFEVDRAATTMYHTHANSVKQLARGLVGPLIIRDPALEQSPKYDRDFTLVLHEIEGLFTINGHAFPATLADEESLLVIEEGERIIVRFINAGQQHHPMHLHGHQFKVVAVDGSPLPNPYWVNTIDVPPGQTVDVEIHGDNPGTWTFHCHILPHVTNRGVYPGGMLTVLDYADHTSYFEGAPAPEQPERNNTASAPATTSAPTTTEAVSGTLIEVNATEFAFSPNSLSLRAGEEVTIRLNNTGSIEHNLEIPEFGVLVEAAAGQVVDVSFTVPNDGGATAFFCSIAGHREAGMEGGLVVDT